MNWPLIWPKWKQNTDTPTNQSSMYLQLIAVHAWGCCGCQPHGGKKILIKWQLVIELLYHVLSISLPSSHSLFACIINQKAATIIHDLHHIVGLLHTPSTVDNIINCSLYGICNPHLHIHRIILHLFTWDHERLVSSLIYDSRCKNNLLPQLNQPFQCTETRFYMSP